jgi:DSBA-like thioredoxin domain
MTLGVRDFMGICLLVKRRLPASVSPPAPAPAPRLPAERRRGHRCGAAANDGFEKKDAARLAAEPRELARTEKEAKEMLGRGVTGVPFFVFGAKVAVSGAQSADVLRGAIAKAAAAA